jgi:hypothetical protein
MNGFMKATSGRAASKHRNEDEENPGERTAASTATDTPDRGADALSWVHADSPLEEYNSGWHMAGVCRTHRAEDQVVGIWQDGGTRKKLASGANAHTNSRVAIPC